MKSKFRLLFIASLICFNTLISSLFGFICLYNNNVINALPCSTLSQSDKLLLPSLKEIFHKIFRSDTVKKDERKIYVYAGGYPLGFTLECKGVLIVTMGEVETEYGLVSVVKNKNVKEGDVLYSIGGEVITSALHLQEILNRENYEGQELDVVIKRKEQYINEKLTPAKEISSGMYRLGLWIRDNAAGVGTLTYVREDNGRFGALGHPVCDIDTGAVMPISAGSIYKCNIVGFNKGMRKNPGELRGLFLKNGQKAGELDHNCEYGVYGMISEEYKQHMSKPIEVGFRDSVKTGKAKMLCTIDGTEPKAYDIEIVKLSYQTKSDKKSMVIKVVDKNLIEQTGGIVQGMSGSPIIQNGKLVGAVTHVFISDPTKGFGLYIDWMIDN
ncbi:MAG: SpoIVB peptidase [Clostridia bacterium]|nr:SpoIVB peptidase [Clostridia bacterium]